MPIMKVIAFESIDKPLRLAELPVPAPAADSLTVRVHACGICGSDLHAAQTPGMLREGSVLGHEFAGEVVEVGADAGADWRTGDRIVALPLRACGTCAPCRDGRQASCEAPATQGFNPALPGAYAEYASCQAVMAMKIPDTMSYDEAAMIEPFAVALNAYKMAKVPPGADVLIVGAGVIGLAIATWARFFGAGDIAISDLVPERLARARDAGAAILIDASNVADPVAELRRATGRPPMFIFECVGRPILQKLINMAPPKAHLVIAGACLEPEKVSVLSATIKRLRVSFAFTYEREDFEFSLRMLADGRIRATPFISSVIGLDEVPATFEALKKPNTHCKVMIRNQASAA
ncbi:Zn-dependent alcohol dehydrogenase (plasmid) [Burkholderia sp. SFA1]|uniref:alcohol dehydrogenase catalytic domain-containing protein n=2 Tax=unclassified Caballeronia TaxID=2646786 RepID=UPI001F364A16|nr:alcohol dehydrogenase catalytic domain-containing protein [Caballeronia sp. PC1]MCE4546637.1 alcohol dehydrogenase catalytic domain-containing protein [Caballeronia sp. PC1]BBQ01732.1 Zn-dependent alcohol dehydrogenase [Burkholderia sp. SFA1]